MVRIIMVVLFLLIGKVSAQTHSFSTTQPLQSGPTLMIGPFGFPDSMGTSRSLQVLNTHNNDLVASHSATIQCQQGAFPDWQCGLFQPMTALSNDGFTAFHRNRPSGFEGLIFDVNLQIIDSINGAIGMLDQHELRIWNQKLYTLYTDFSAIPGSQVMGVQVQDSATKQLLYSWSTDSIPSACADSIFDTSLGDYFHLNSVWPFYWNQTEWLLISSRNLSSLILLNTSNNQYSLIGGTCSDVSIDVPFSGQHDAKVLETDGSKLLISLFNNGLNRGYSSGSIYELDILSKTCTLKKEIVHPDSVLGHVMGGFEVWDEGYIIAWGAHRTLQYPAVSIYTTDLTTPIWELTFDQNQVNTYRAIGVNWESLTHRAELPTTSPEYEYYWGTGPGIGTKVVGMLPIGTLLFRQEVNSHQWKKIILKN